jgi:antitoxin ParD1/3/4
LISVQGSGILETDGLATGDAPMNIDLGSQWQAFIDESIKSGRYLSASEVVLDGLRLLQEKEQLRRLHMDDLRKEVDKGLTSLDRGEYLELDEEGMKAYLEDVNERGRERLAGRKTSTK